MSKNQSVCWETLSLFQDYQQSPRSDLRNQIMQLNLGLVRKEAYYWVNQCKESYEDLFQVGSLGLIRAIERFNIQKGNCFSSFAIPYIRGAIQHYLRDQSATVRIPRRWLELQRQAQNFRQEFSQTFHRKPTDLESANQLKISLAEWQDIKLAALNQNPLSLDASLPNEEGDQIYLGELFADPHYRSFQLAQEDSMSLEQALAQLEEKIRKIVEFVFLQGLTHKEAAEILGISLMTVHRHLKKGLSLLKNLMGIEGSPLVEDLTSC